MQAYVHLIQWCVSRGYTFKVNDGEEKTLTASPEETQALIDNLDEAGLEIFGPTTQPTRAERLGWAWVTGDVAMAPEESVIDHTDNELLKGWWSRYMQMQAVERFAEHAGRTWKAKLLDAWRTVVWPGYVDMYYRSYLQQLRNQSGPDWLRNANRKSLI